MLEDYKPLGMVRSREIGGDDKVLQQSAWGNNADDNFWDAFAVYQPDLRAREKQNPRVSLVVCPDRGIVVRTEVAQHGKYHFRIGKIEEFGNDFDAAIEGDQKSYNELFDYQTKILGHALDDPDFLESVLTSRGSPVLDPDITTPSDDYFIRNKDKIKAELADSLVKVTKKKQLMQKKPKPKRFFLLFSMTDNPLGISETRVFEALDAII